MDYFCKLERWVSFQDESCSYLIVDYKTTSKTITHIFQPRNLLKCQIILKKNTNLIIYCPEKKPVGFLFEITLANAKWGGGGGFFTALGLDVSLRKKLDII